MIPPSKSLSILSIGRIKISAFPRIFLKVFLTMAVRARILPNNDDV